MGIPLLVRQHPVDHRWAPCWPLEPCYQETPICTICILGSDSHTHPPAPTPTIPSGEPRLYNNEITWMLWLLKSQATRMLVQQLGWSWHQRKHQSSISLVLCEGNAAETANETFWKRNGICLKYIARDLFNNEWVLLHGGTKPLL